MNKRIRKGSAVAMASAMDLTMQTDRPAGSETDQQGYRQTEAYRLTLQFVDSGPGALPAVAWQAPHHC
jgi:hypothetical protein